MVQHPVWWIEGQSGNYGWKGRLCMSLFVETELEEVFHYRMMRFGLTWENGCLLCHTRVQSPFTSCGVVLGTADYSISSTSLACLPPTKPLATHYADCQLWTICSFFQGRSCLFANCTRVTLGSIEIRTPPRRSLHGACEITCTLIPGEGHQWVLGSKVMETSDRILRRTEMKSSDYSGKMSNMKEKSFCSELGTTPNGISPFELLHFWLSHAIISFLPCN